MHRLYNQGYITSHLIRAHPYCWNYRFERLRNPLCQTDCWKHPLNRGNHKGRLSLQKTEKSWSAVSAMRSEWQQVGDKHLLICIWNAALTTTNCASQITAQPQHKGDQCHKSTHITMCLCLLWVFWNWRRTAWKKIPILHHPPFHSRGKWPSLQGWQWWCVIFNASHFLTHSSVHRDVVHNNQRHNSYGRSGINKKNI